MHTTSVVLNDSVSAIIGITLTTYIYINSASQLTRYNHYYPSMNLHIISSLCQKQFFLQQ